MISIPLPNETSHNIHKWSPGLFLCIVNRLCKIWTLNPCPDLRSVQKCRLSTIHKLYWVKLQLSIWKKKSFSESRALAYGLRRPSLMWMERKTIFSISTRAARMMLFLTKQTLCFQCLSLTLLSRKHKNKGISYSQRYYSLHRRSYLWV